MQLMLLLFPIHCDFILNVEGHYHLTFSKHLIPRGLFSCSLNQLTECMKEFNYSFACVHSITGKFPECRFAIFNPTGFISVSLNSVYPWLCMKGDFKQRRITSSTC